MSAFIEVKLGGFDRAARRLIRAGANVKPAFQKARRGVRKDQREHMSGQEAPKKKVWAPLAQSTRARRLQRLRRGTRVSTKRGKRGNLKKKVQRQLNRVLSKKMITARNAKIKIGRSFVRITSKVGRAHQEGKRVGHGSKLPKRPFLYFSEALQAAVKQRIADHLRDAFDKP